MFNVHKPLIYLMKVCETHAVVQLTLNHTIGGKKVYLCTSNNNQLDPFASELTMYDVHAGVKDRMLGKRALK